MKAATSVATEPGVKTTEWSKKAALNFFEVCAFYFKNLF